MAKIQSARLHTRFTLGIGLVITLTVLLFSAVFLFFNARLSQKSLEEKVERLLVLTAQSLAYSLWQYDRHSINVFLDALFRDQALLYVQVEMEGGERFERIREGFKAPGLPVDSSAELISARETVIYNDLKVGSVTLLLTNQGVNRQLLREGLTLLLLALLLNSVVIFFLYCLANRHIFKPLRSLEKSALEVASGNFAATIAVTGDDEIGRLGEAFKKMLKGINELTASKDELNKEIKARKKVKRAMEKTIALLNTAEEIGSSGSWSQDLATGREQWSRGEFLLHGLDEGLDPSYELHLRFVHPEDREAHARLFEQHLISQETTFSQQYRMLLPTGEVKFIQADYQINRDAEGRAVSAQGTDYDITEVKEADDALRISEQRYLSLFENAPVPLWEEDLTELMTHLANLADQGVTNIRHYLHGRRDRLLECLGKIRAVNINRAALELYGATSKEDLLQNLAAVFSENSFQVFENEVVALFQGERFFEAEGETRTLQGQVKKVVIQLKAETMPDGRMRGLVATTDITEHELLKAQLIQAQRLESVGRLAGGVAHDYNNALSIIIGFAEMNMENSDPQGEVYDGCREILAAAKHAAEITRQLLAFARKQPIAPQIVSLNSKIKSTLNMLRRLIGEDIELEWQPSEDLWLVKMDPVQIDQTLANLCVNARDAIANVGTVVIATSNEVVGEQNCKPGQQPGEYVMFSVTDDGSGMDESVLSNVFEPFFTTKDVDQGTGLGLATVYGIVQQNKGFIDLQSTLGHGTSVRIYLPRYRGEGELESGLPVTEVPRGNGETILLTEDDLAVLQLTMKNLTGLGYRVLAAPTPNQAILVAEAFGGEIQLLLTDVIMPQMNGRELAHQLMGMYPGLKVIFMSGYTADLIAQHGVLDEQVNFIQKPFSKRDIGSMVRKVLDGITMKITSREQQKED